MENHFIYNRLPCQLLSFALVCNLDYFALRPALIRNLGTFKGNAHREREPSVGTHEHRYNTDLRKNNEPETRQRPDDAGRQAQCIIQGHQGSITH